METFKLVLSIIGALGLPSLIILAVRAYLNRSSKRLQREFMASLPPGGTVYFQTSEPKWLEGLLKSGQIVRGPDGRGVMRPPFKG